MKISHIARACSEALGSPKAFFSAVLLIIIWALVGPFFQFSSAWQLAINSSTTIFTFLALFLLQHSQNSDTKAIHLKLDELIMHDEKSSNQFMHAEKQEVDSLNRLEKLHEGSAENGHDDDLDKSQEMYYTMGGE